MENTRSRSRRAAMDSSGEAAPVRPTFQAPTIYRRTASAGKACCWLFLFLVAAQRPYIFIEA
jgi:hypothetical protein